ncbi:MAG TPA: peptidylprolyl isomerase [Steroidobacteraceae bacterium]|jgi:cyclophilin family peptidyl-prolyl cis-trans isomerase|nr:peptidylprolyl isomerase [Steroidobacteraceae bacterium]
MKHLAWRSLAAALLVLNLTPALAANTPRVRVTTSMGQFVIELAPERAPLTVANFLRYVREGHYTDTLIHRVVGNFVIQGGGHAASDMQLKPSHDPVVNESGNGLQNKRGAVGLARSDSPHSGNAQFYVDIADNSDLDPLATRWGYAVFGHVVEGMDVVDRIGAVATGSVGPFKSDAPLKPIIIQKIEEVNVAAAAPAPSPPAAAPPPPATPAAPTPPSH